MSHFTSIKTQIKDKELLLKALTDLGLKFETGEDLKVHGFAGMGSAVDIRVRIPLSYDIGLREQNGAYVIVADWFGVRGFTQQTFTDKLNQRYSYHATRSRLETQGFNLVEEEVKETGQVRLVLRRMA